MKELPHRYVVTATATTAGDVRVAADGLPVLPSASPVEFGGPGDRWSPETMLVAAVGDCFVLTFRAVAAASRLSWVSLDCAVTGTLDQIERAMQFTGFEVRARLMLPPGVDHALAQRALEKAERNCLVTNSLKAAVRLETEIGVVLEPAATVAGA